MPLERERRHFSVTKRYFSHFVDSTFLPTKNKSFFFQSVPHTIKISGRIMFISMVNRISGTVRMLEYLYQLCTHVPGEDIKKSIFHLKNKRLFITRDIFLKQRSFLCF